MISGMRKRVIERTARECRPQATYGLHDPFCLAREKGWYLFRYPIGEDKTLGLSQNRSEGKVIFTNSSALLCREIFTFAHEVGHLLLHTQPNSKVFKDDKMFVNQEQEREADYFASCLLLPRDNLRNYLEDYCQVFQGKDIDALTIAMVMHEFRVSSQTVLIALRDYKHITPKEEQELAKMLEGNVNKYLRAVSQSDDTLLKPSNVIRYPEEFLKIIRDNYKNNKIPKKVAEYFCAFSMTDFNSIFPHNHLDDEETFRKVGLT